MVRLLDEAKICTLARIRFNAIRFNGKLKPFLGVFSLISVNIQYTYVLGQLFSISGGKDSILYTIFALEYNICDESQIRNISRIVLVCQRTIHFAANKQ